VEACADREPLTPGRIEKPRLQRVVLRGLGGLPEVIHDQRVNADELRAKPLLAGEPLAVGPILRQHVDGLAFVFPEGDECLCHRLLC
jgi:hypothetical protein